MSAVDARRQIEKHLFSIQGVVGVGGGEDKINVYVEGSPGNTEIPTEVAGLQTQIFKVGHIRALPLMDPLLVSLWGTEAESLTVSRTGKVRPSPCGVSVGHYKITAGTLGMVLQLGSRLYGISNNHVLANASTSKTPNAQLGDPIYQPGPYDGGTEADTIGKLATYVPIDTDKANIVDVAAFEPINESDISTEILEIGIPSGFRNAVVGDSVRKSGRTTGLNTGIVQDIDATIQVDYGGFTATFNHQILTSYMANGGDSGSALVAADSLEIVGLLFAGSEYVTIHNHIANVLNALRYQPSATGGGNLLGQLLPAGVGLALLAALV